MFIISLMISLFTASCNNSSNDSLQSNKKCVEAKASNYIEEVTGSDTLSYYSMLLTFEESMMTEGILASKTQKSYIRLFDKLMSNDEKVQKFYDKGSSQFHEYGMISGLVMQDVIFTCPFEMVRSDSARLTEKWEPRFILAEQLTEAGFRNKEMFAAYVNSYSKDEFDEIVYRGPIINVIIFLLERKYNREIDYKESGKIFKSND